MSRSCHCCSTPTPCSWQTDDPQLSAAARAAIADESNDVFVSAASAWEIATKVRLGKLPGFEEAAERFVDLVDADGFQSLPMPPRHALRAGACAVPHRDAFDRMLAAQSALEGLVLLTRDSEFTAFGTVTLW